MFEWEGVMTEISPPTFPLPPSSSSPPSVQAVSAVPARAAVISERRAMRCPMVCSSVIGRGWSCPGIGGDALGVGGDAAGGLRRGAALLQPCLALVEDHGDHDDHALDDGLPEAGDADEDESVGEEADHEGADEGAPDAAPAAGEGGAADDDGRDGVELEGLAGLRGGGGQLRG